MSNILTGIRLGDFIEFFDNDAEKASELFQITKTKYFGSKTEWQGKTMCGIPAHSVERYKTIASQQGYILTVASL